MSVHGEGEASGSGPQGASDKTTDMLEGIADSLDSFATTIRSHAEQYEADEVENRRARDLFVGMVAHELRTPVVALRSRLELLAREVTTEAGSKMVEQLLESCDDLVQISSDLLDFQKIEAGELSLHQAPFIPRLMLNRIAQDQTAISKNFKTRFDVQVLGLARHWRLGDRHRLLQILSNVLGNAQKHSEGGDVTLIADFQSPDCVVFTIKDTGPGMTPEEVEIIFAPYRQLPAGQSSTTGTGLGLVVVQHLVDLMDGEIIVKSVKGEGTSFQITLPMALCAPPDGITAHINTGTPAPALDLNGLTLLHVDDDKLQGDLLTALLKNTGIHVFRMHSVEAAITFLSHRRCDFLICDLYLPDGTGQDVISFLRRQEKKGTHPSGRVMLVSAAIPETERDSLAALHIDQIVIKPLRRKALYDFLSPSKHAEPAPEPHGPQTT